MSPRALRTSRRHGLWRGRGVRCSGSHERPPSRRPPQDLQGRDPSSPRAANVGYRDGDGGGVASRERDRPRWTSRNVRAKSSYVRAPPCGSSDHVGRMDSDQGDAVCYNAQKGDTLWSHYFNNPFYASPIICDDKLWMIDRQGIMHVADATGKFKLLAESPLGENSDSSPAFSDGRIYLRGKDNLFCIAKD